MSLADITHYKDMIAHWIIIHSTLAIFFVFLLTFVESLAVIGMLVPSTVPMTFFGTLVGAQLLPAGTTLVWAMIGAILGDGISYGIGYYYKDHLREVWPFRAHPKWVSNAERFFNRHGGKSVFLGRIGPLRAFVPIVAGMLHMRPIAFFAANIPSIVLWAPLYMLPGILLGIASLQLPPNTATRFLLTLFTFLVVLWLTGWLIKRCLYWLLNKFDILLDHIWQRCKTQSSLRPLYLALQDPYHPERHGQLTSACVLCLFALAFLILAYMVGKQNASLLYINNAVHFFFRTLHTQWGMKTAIVLSTLGDKLVLLPMLIPLAIYLLLKRQRYSAWHWLSVGVLSAGSIFVFKHLIQATRPTDLAGHLGTHSFPSGHTTLSIALWGFIAVMLARVSKPAYRWISYSAATLIVIIVLATRLYLGVHWLTDIIGGVLLGISCVLFISISYRRLPTKPLNPIALLLVCLLSFILINAIYLPHVWHRQVEQYQPVWPTLSISERHWWHKQTQQIPLFRPNRFGHSAQRFNLQWQGDITLLRKVLLRQGWRELDDQHLASLLQRLAAKPDARELPLIPVTYLNRHAVLIMVKAIPNQHALLVLHVWDANIRLYPGNKPLRLGTVDYFIPYHSIWSYWRHRPKHAAILPKPTVLLGPSLAQVQWKIRYIGSDEIPPSLPADLKQQAPYRIILARA